MCVLWEIISLIRYPTARCGSERTTALLLIKVILKHLSLPLFGPLRRGSGPRLLSGGCEALGARQHCQSLDAAVCRTPKE